MVRPTRCVPDVTITFNTCLSTLLHESMCVLQCCHDVDIACVSGCRPLNRGFQRQAWLLRRVSHVAASDGAPLYSIVLRGGPTAAEEWFLSAACAAKPSLSWFTDVTSTWCRSHPKHMLLEPMPSPDLRLYGTFVGLLRRA